MFWVRWGFFFLLSFLGVSLLGLLWGGLLSLFLLILAKMLPDELSLHFLKRIVSSEIQQGHWLVPIRGVVLGCGEFTHPVLKEKRLGLELKITSGGPFYRVPFYAPFDAVVIDIVALKSLEKENSGVLLSLEDRWGAQRVDIFIRDAWPVKKGHFPLLPGDLLKAGSLIGTPSRFSRVFLFLLEDNMEVLVSPGEKLIPGETFFAREKFSQRGKESIQ